MCFPVIEIITAAKDMVLAIAASVTAFVAVKGLSTWNRQLRGTAGFDVARSLAKYSYKVRDKLQVCRSPLLSAHEFPDDYYEDELKKTPEKKAKGYAFVYSNRWIPVLEALQEFDASTLEAEALWGGPIRQATDQLRKVVREVSVAIDAFIANAANDGDDFSSDREFGKEMRANVSSLPTDSENPINIKLTAAIQSIDDQLRLHLQ